MKLSSCFLILCFIYVSSVYAAVPAPPNYLDMLRSETMRDGQKILMRSMFRTLRSGTGTNMMLFGMIQNPQIAAELGVTPEQSQQIREAGQNMQSRPEFAELETELQKLQNPVDPFFLNASQQTRQSYLAVQEKLAAMMTEYLPEQMDRIFTEEQKQNVRELQIAAMGVMLILNPDMFESLDLSQEQRAAMQEIEAELEPEFDRIADEIIDAQYAGLDLVYEQMEKDGSVIANQAEIRKFMLAAIKKLEARGVNYKTTGKDKLDRAQDFDRKFKFRMFDVLTDKQMERMSDLINNPPSWMDNILANIKKSRESRSKAVSWQPGPDSWQPGDPISDEYRKVRKARFPQAKQVQ